MLLLFKRNDFTSFFILIFFAFLLRTIYFIEVPAIEELGDFYISSFYSWIWLKKLYLFSPRLYLILSTIFWILFSVYLKHIIITERLIPKKSFTSAMAFILYAAILPYFVYFSVQALAAVLLFIAFAQALKTQYNVKSTSHYFLIGLIIGLATFLYWPSILFFFGACWILLSLRLFVLQEFVAFILGLLMPFYFFISLDYIFTGHIDFAHWLMLPISFPSGIINNTSTVVVSILSILLLFYGLYLSRNGISDNRLQMIRKWNAVVVYYIFAALIGVFSVRFPSASWIFSIIPFSIILSSAFSNNLKKYNTFTYYIVLLAVLSVQWLIRFI